MNSESQEVKRLFSELCERSKHSFPKHRQSLDAPSKQGVYIIRKEKTVLHIGRTLRGKDGLYQRLKNHLHSSSSFTNNHLQGKGAILREDGYTYQYIEEKAPRKRALLEAYATGILCPEYLGLVEKI
jgi:hypothetical protein